MKHIIGALIMFSLVLAGNPSGKNITYKIDGDKYEGYYISPSLEAPLVLLVHDWDGLTGYEIKRAGMLMVQAFAPQNSRTNMPGRLSCIKTGAKCEPVYAVL